MADRTSQVLHASDGRALSVAQWGDPYGTPVLQLHGTPGSRLDRHPDEALVRAAGVRLVTFDRPGYGGSDRHRGRRVVECVPDVEADPVKVSTPSCSTAWACTRTASIAHGSR